MMNRGKSDTKRRKRRRRRLVYYGDPSITFAFFVFINPIFSFYNKPSFYNQFRRFECMGISKQLCLLKPPCFTNSPLYSSWVTRSAVDITNSSTHENSIPIQSKTPPVSLSTTMKTNHHHHHQARTTPLLSKEQIQDIKSHVDILTVIESCNLPQFTRHGDGIRATAICPFHEDTHPSLSIDKSRGIFKCFACGVGGDIFHFIREYDYRIRSCSSLMTQQLPQPSNHSSIKHVLNKMSYPRAIQYVVQNFLPMDKVLMFEKYLPSSIHPNATTTTRTTMKLGDSSLDYFNFTLLKQRQQQEQESTTWYEYHPKHVTSKERIYLANLAAADYYGNLLITLPMAGIARTHLRQRNIGPTTVRSFALGYAPDFYHYPSSSSSSNHPISLVYYLYKLGFTPTEIVDAGLAVLTTFSKKRIQGTLKQWQRKRQTLSSSSSSTSITSPIIKTNRINTTTTFNTTIDSLLEDTTQIIHSNTSLLNAINTSSSKITTNFDKPPMIQFNIYDIIDRFRSRLIVPIFDINGTHIVGFGGRYLNGDDDDDDDDEKEQQGPNNNNKKFNSIANMKTDDNSTTQEDEVGDIINNEKNNYTKNKFKNAKYINSPESVVFSKKHILFGLNTAISCLMNREKRSIEETPSFVVVEGYFDVIALHDVGVKEAVASMGTSLSLEQLSLIASILQKHNQSYDKPSKVIICLDNDSAGIRAVDKLCQSNIFHQLVQTFSVAICVATLPEGIKDPSDFIESKKNMGILHVGDLFRKEILQSAMPWERWYITHLVNTLITNDPASATVVYNRVAKLISIIKDIEKRNLLTSLAVDFILDRQSAINTTILIRSVVESELISRIGDSGDENYQPITSKRKGLIKRIPTNNLIEYKGPLVREASMATKSRRQLKIKKSSKMKGPLIDHFSGFKFNPQDASWLGIDEAEWNRRGNLVLGKSRLSEDRARTYHERSRSKNVVYFNSDEYLGKKFLTRDAIVAGYNPTIRRKYASNMRFGTGNLLEHDSNCMLDTAERFLLKILTLSPKARVSMKALVSGGKHAFMEWSSVEREWLFQCLIDAPGREPLPFFLQNNGTSVELRQYLTQLHDCPPGAFREDVQNGSPGIEYEVELSMLSDISEASHIHMPSNQAKMTVMKEANALFYEEDDLSSLRPPSAASADSLQFIFDNERNDGEIQLISDHSNDDAHIDFLIQVAFSNVIDAQATRSLKLLSKKWIEQSSAADQNPENQHSPLFVENILPEKNHKTNDILFIRSRLNMMMRTKLNIAESSKRLTAKLLSSLKSEDGEGTISTKQQQSLVKIVDDFVSSLPEDSHRPESFDENYIFGLDNYDEKVDSRFSGKPSTKINWEAVKLNFDSILE